MRIHEDGEGVGMGIYANWKQFHGYRKADGPEQCGNCVHFTRYPHWGGKVFMKCREMGFSESSASDIRASYVCNEHEEANR